MSEEFKFDVFLNHSSKDKSVVRDLAARLKRDGFRVWLDEEQIKPGQSIPAKIEEGLEHSRVLVLCMSANAFGSDWAQLEAGTFRFRDPMNLQRRFIPLRLDDAPIRGSLAQFLYINWLPAAREQEYLKLVEACRVTKNPVVCAGLLPDEKLAIVEKTYCEQLGKTDDDYIRRRRDSIQKVFSAFEPIHTLFFKICIDYLSLVEILHAGLKATDADRVKFHEYIREIGRKLHEMHLMEGRLAVIGADGAVHAMQQYPFQATEVNDMVRLQLPCKKTSEVTAVTDELFRRKAWLYEELAKALKDSGSDKVKQPPITPERRCCPIGDTWGGLRGVLQQEYSTQIIRGFLGKAGLPISKIEYRGTFKGPVLDEADKLVSSMDDQARDRFVIGCIQEIVSFEQSRATNLAKPGLELDSQTLEDLRRVLARFGHDLEEF